MHKKIIILFGFIILPSCVQANDSIKPYAALSYIHDNNVFRLSDSIDPRAVINSSDKSDSVRRATIGVKGELPFSRQQINFNAQAEDVRYKQFDFLGHSTRKSDITWLWQAGSNADGVLSYQQNRRLSEFTYTQSAIKNLITDKEALFRGNLRLVPDWIFYGEASGTDKKHGAASQATWDRNATSLMAGVRYATPLQNSVGYQTKKTYTRYSNRQFVSGSYLDNRHIQTEALVMFDWRLGSKSRISGNIGRTSLRHEQLAARDFNGKSWRLGYDWMLDSKVALNLSHWKSISSYETTTSSYYARKGKSIGATWTPTGKIKTQLNWSRENLGYHGDPGYILSSSPQRNDILHAVNLSGVYAPVTNVEISLSYGKSKRDSTITLAGFRDTTLFLNVTLGF